MKQRLRPVMSIGTCSDAGKSIISAAFRRIFKQDGYQPTPFKAQDMSLNSYSTPGGGEIGRTQVVQVEACGISPRTDMNPVLLKPTSDKSPQVVSNGKPVDNIPAKDYFGMQNQREELFEETIEAFKHLKARYNPIVLERAGSIPELNLRDRNITNTRMTIAAGTSTYLVVDIDRRSVFNSVYGTIALLRPGERVLMKGVIINKFRRDASLFEEGRSLLEELTEIPMAGVIPWSRNIKIEEEDSVTLDMRNNTYKDRRISVAIILLKRMSNFTDFDILEMDPRLNPYYTNGIDGIEKADIIPLPGSKNTLSDLRSLWANGTAMAIIRVHKTGKRMIGICGSYQMMGVRLEDPESIEGDIPAISGLGLLPQCTVIKQEKIAKQSDFALLPSSESEDYKRYEVHMERTTLLGDAPEQPIAWLEDGLTSGYYLNNWYWGSHIHDILDNPAVLDNLAEDFDTETTTGPFDYAAFKEEQYDELAALIRGHMDMEYIYSSIKN